MATNFFFNNFRNSQEQTLIEDLIIESIKIYGLDMYYIPRSPTNPDEVLGEDESREYLRAIPVELYVKNVEGFAGEGDFLSKFNIQIRDQMTLSIARRVFEDEVSAQVTTPVLTRPNEGDLIFFPLNNKIFEIKFVEHEAVFYQMGALQFYDLKCELFVYNNEYFATGIDAVDNLMNNYTLALNNDALLLDGSQPPNMELTDEDGYTLMQEGWDINNNDNLATNDELQAESDNILDFTEHNPFSEGGTF
ncbi:hypothetical protein EBT25_13280 [bacterium]|nr:hypothetical protein [bacterium]